MQRLISMTTIILLVLLAPAVVWTQSTTASLQPITPIEAVHLVEAQVQNLSTTTVRQGAEQGVPVYYVEGTADEDGYFAVVDARVARVLRVTKNSAPFSPFISMLL